MNRHAYISDYKKPFMYFDDDAHGKRWQLRKEYADSKPPVETYLKKWPKKVIPHVIGLSITFPPVGYTITFSEDGEDGQVTITPKNLFKHYEPL